MFPVLMKKLLARQITGIDKEIIIVESNSTDNSRQLVLEYKDHPEVKSYFTGESAWKGERGPRRF